MLTSEKQLNINHSTVLAGLQHNRSGYMLCTHPIANVTCNITHKSKETFKKMHRQTNKCENKTWKKTLTMWYSLNEIIAVFIWVTSNYAASNKPLWSHILALTPHSQKKTCVHTYTHKRTQTRLHAHTCPLQTLSGCAHNAVLHKYLQAHMHFIVFTHDCSSHVNIDGNLQDVSQSSLPTLTHKWYIICKWSWNGAIAVMMWLCDQRTIKVRSKE